MLRYDQVLSGPIFLLPSALVRRVGCPDSAFVGARFQAVCIVSQIRIPEHEVNRIINALNTVACALCIEYTQPLVAAMGSHNYSQESKILQSRSSLILVSPARSLLSLYYDIRGKRSVEIMGFKSIMCQRSVNYTSSRTEYLTVATLAFVDPTSKSIRHEKDESVQDQLVDYSYIIIEGFFSLYRIFSDGIIVFFYWRCWAEVKLQNPK